jgi:hypothetical protein
MVLFRLGLVVGLVSLLVAGTEAQVYVRSGTGEDRADLRDIVNAFRNDIGGGLVSGSNGSFEGIRREINWDGVNDNLATPNFLPLDFFNKTSPRGIILSAPGGVRVSADATNPSGTPLNFGNINPHYAVPFVPFSGQRMFSPIGGTILDIQLFVPGTTNPAFVRSFGAVFNDVDLPGATWIEYFDSQNESLGRYYVPQGSTPVSLSFLGVTFYSKEISRVRISSGSLPMSAENVDSASADVVVMDDFVYSEPVARAATAAIGAVFPNGGETLTIGSQIAVAWAQSNPSSSVAIDLARSGEAFETTIANTSDDGSETITVPGPATGEARVRVRSLAAPSNIDVSNGTFAIVQPTADLRATLRDLKAVKRGQKVQVTGTLAVVNQGPAASGNFFTFTSGAARNARAAGATVLQQREGGALAPGQSVGIPIRATVSGSPRNLSLAATIVVQGPAADPDLPNNRVDGSVKVATKKK